MGVGVPNGRGTPVLGSDLDFLGHLHFLSREVDRLLDEVPGFLRHACGNEATSKYSDIWTRLGTHLTIKGVKPPLKHLLDCAGVGTGYLVHAFRETVVEKREATPPANVCIDQF